METGGWPEIDGARRGKVRRVLLVLGFLACGAATGKMSYDIMQIRGATAAARSIANDSQRTADERRDGIVVIVFDAIESVDVLRRVAGHDDATGEQARLALEKIEQAARRR
jgi:hypothetical protein